MLIVLFKLENDYRRVSFVIFLSRDTLLFVTLVLVKITILWKFNRRSLKTFTRSQKSKTVTFKNYILAFYGSNMGTTTCIFIEMI